MNRSGGWILPSPARRIVGTLNLDNGLDALIGQRSADDRFFGDGRPRVIESDEFPQATIPGDLEHLIAKRFLHLQGHHGTPDLAFGCTEGGHGLRCHYSVDRAANRTDGRPRRGNTEARHEQCGADEGGGASAPSSPSVAPCGDSARHGESWTDAGGCAIARSPRRTPALSGRFQRRVRKEPGG